MADICHFSGNDIFHEINPWPLALAAVYFKVQYVTRNFFASVAFVYLFEAFFFSANALYHYFHDHADDSSVAHFLSTKILSVFATSDDKTFMCYESVMVSLIGAPLIAILAISLWSFGAERLIGVKYKTTTIGIQHAVLWSTFAIAIAVGSTPLFSPRGDVVKRRYATLKPDEINVPILFVTLLCVILSALIPFHSALKNGTRSKAYSRSLRAYVVFSLFVIFMVFFSEFARPFMGGFRSSYVRTLVSLSILYCSCVLFWLARFFYNTCHFQNRKEDL